MVFIADKFKKDSDVEDSDTDNEQDSLSSLGFLQTKSLLGFMDNDNPKPSKKVLEIKGRKMVSIDQEIALLEGFYNQNNKAVIQDVNNIRKRINNYVEPEAVEILENKIARER